MAELRPEAEYWEDTEGARHYAADTADAKRGDTVVTDEEKRWQASLTQRSADADSQRERDRLEYEAEELYEKLQENGVIQANDEEDDERPISKEDAYTMIYSYVSSGDIPVWKWEHLDREHGRPERIEEADALEAFYKALVTADEELNDA